MSLVHLFRQLPLPGTGCHGRREPPDADRIGQDEPGQPFVADAPQRTSQVLIILSGNPVRIVLQKFGFESAEHLPNHGKLLRQPVTLPWSALREHGHHHLFAGQEDAGPVALGTWDRPVAPAPFAGGDPSTGFPDPPAPSAFGTAHHFVSLARGTGKPLRPLPQNVSLAQPLATPRIICYPG